MRYLVACLFAPPPVPATAGTYPQPQPAYYPQPYPPPQPYPTLAYPAPPPMAIGETSRRRRMHDGEVIADFAVVTSNDGESRTEDGDVVAGAMTAGLWAGFGLGVMMSKDYSPDPRFAQARSAPSATASKSASPTAIVPWVGASGQLGVMTGGSF